MKPSTVCRDHFRLLNVLLYIGRQQDLSNIYTLVLNHGIERIHWEPSISSTSSFVNSAMKGRSLTFPAPIPIVEITDEDGEEIDRFPINSPHCMVQDQSANNTWKNLASGLCSTFNKRKPSIDVSWTIHSPLFRISARRKFRTKLILSQKSWNRLLMPMVVILPTWYLQKRGNVFYEIFK